MNLDKFEKIINEAFEIKEKINANSDKLIIDAIKEIYDSIDSKSSRKQYNKKLIEQASIEWIFHPD